MNILQTPARFYPFVGGVEKYTLTLCKELVRKGHEVTVICANEPKEKSVDEYHGIRVKRLFSIGKIANTNITPFLPFKLLDGHYDVIHTHIPTPWSADCSLIISLIKNVPLVVTYHNDIGGRGGYHSIATLYNRIFLRFVLTQATSIIVTSSSFSTPFLTPYRNKVVIIPNSVDTEIFKPVPRQMTADILFLGVLDNYHHYKGFEILLAALKEVSHEIPRVRLIVGGTGSMKEYYINLSRSLGIAENVEFAGYIPDEKLADVYNGCKMVVLPSIDPTREGFGIVLLEAMASGRPVISTNITGVAEDIRNCGAGLVIEPGSVVALAEAIKTILGDEDLANRMGSAGRALVLEKYGSDCIAEQVEKLCYHAIQKKGKKLWGPKT